MKTITLTKSLGILTLSFAFVALCNAQSQGPNSPDTVINNPAQGKAVWKSPLHALLSFLSAGVYMLLAYFDIYNITRKLVIRK